MLVVIEYDSFGNITHAFQPGSIKLFEPTDNQIVLKDIDVFHNHRAYYVNEDTEVVYRGLPPTNNHVWKNNKWQFDRGTFLDRVRAERNKRLAESDWAALPDTPVDWSEYRKALRNLPETLHKEQSLDEVKWPEKPNGE